MRSLSPRARALAGAAALALLSPAARAQQFDPRPVGGPSVWTERAAVLDADADGLLDVLFVNCNGWEVPGDLEAPSADPLAPTLMRSTGIDGMGFPVFTDASASFLPAGFVLHGKNVAVADVDDDGLVDLAFAAAYDDQQPLLLRDGAAWVDATATHMPTLVINGWNVAAGDVDDDGDLDLVYADAGPSSFSAPGGLARLLLNDGTGVFTDASSALGAVPKIGAQNARLVDLDGDLDLDVVVDGKSTVTQFYENDGAGGFTLDLTVVPDGVATYETEFADLDGDSDHDLLIMNQTALTDATSQGMLSDTGSFFFRPPATGTFLGPNAHDENDFALIDADDDGDLDVVIATLQFGSPISPERLFLNAGTFGAGFLSNVAGAFGPTIDATLDVAVADFDGDGAYDLVTAQGEYAPFRNLYFRNTGAVDTRAPRVPRLTAGPTTLPLSALTAGWPVRAWAFDAVVDDGETLLEAELLVTGDKNGEQTAATLPMRHVGGELFRALLDVPGGAEGLVNRDLSWQVEAADPGGHTGASAVATTRLCGAESYGTAGPIPGLTLALAGDPTTGESFTVSISGGPPNVAGRLLVGLGRANAPFFGGTLLVDLTGGLLVPLPLDGAGAVSFPVLVDDEPLLVGLGRTAQYVAFDGNQPGGYALSNGVELGICGN